MPTIRPGSSPSSGPRTTTRVGAVSPRVLDVGPMRFPALESGPEDAPLVILLHGFPQSCETWRPVLPELARAGWHTVAPLQRGYAADARPSGRHSYRIEQLVGDVIGMAAELGHARFHLVGHDWGGVVGWVLAAQHPDVLASFTSLATPHPVALARSMVGPQALRSAYAAFFQLPFVPEAVLSAGGNAVLRRVLERSGLSREWTDTYADGLDRAALHAALQWYRAVDLWQLARVPSVHVPTLYLWGSGDQALGRSAAEATSRFVDAAYRFIESDAPHWLPEERTADVVDALVDHLAASCSRS